MRFALGCLVCVLCGCSENEQAGDSAFQRKSENVVASGKASVSAVAQAKPQALTAVEKKELDEISKSNGAVVRNNTSLKLQLATGKTVEFVDKRACDTYENCEHYIYQGQVAGGQFYWVNAGYYEGGAEFLISKKTGEKVDTYREPHLSPDGKYIATASNEEAYGDPGVFLWEITEGAMVSRFRFVPEDYQVFNFVDWVGSEKIELVKIAWPPKGECPEGKLAEFPMMLVEKNGKWLLEAVSEKGKCFQ
jgi:hypothetical protein